MRMTWMTLTLAIIMVLSACSSEQPAATDSPPTESPTDVPPTFTPVEAVSSDAICPEFVQTALDAVDGACEVTGRNQACYGNTLITANPKSESADIQFQEPGDIVDLIQIGSLKLTPLNLETQTWGIAMMRLQANLSDTTPGQNVTFLMFGDVEIENRSADATTNINSFYFASGIGDSACASAPESGLIIQTPEGVGKVDLLINEVDISIGSTAFLQAEADADMVINVVEGEAEVTSQGVTETVVAGNRTTVELDENGVADSPPTSPEPYQVEPLRQLPVRQLPRPVTIQETIETAEFTAIGFEITNSISAPAEVDIFEFEGMAGQMIYVDSLTETSELMWSLHFERPKDADILQDNESRLTTLPPTNADIGLIELPETGTYQVVIQGRNESIGDYHFKVWDVPAPDRPELTRPTDGHERLIGIGTGAIETPGSWDEYTLTVEAGQTIYFDGLESDWNVKWNILGQDDEKFVGLDFDVGRDLEAITFETAGTYILRIWGHRDALGSYTFQLWDVPSPTELTLSKPADASDRLIGMGSGIVDTPGVEFFYTVDVEAGQELYFDGIESDWNIKWNIYTPDDETLVGLDYDVGRDLESFTFDSAETYTVRIWGHLDAIGAYAFQILDVPPISEPVLTLPDDAPDQLIGMGSREIETPGAEHLYTVDVEAGQTIYFDGIESDWNIKWNIYTQDEETLVGLDYDVGRDLEAFTFETAGTYTIRIWGHRDAVGLYSYQLWNVPAFDEPALIRPDDAHEQLLGTGAGEIESPGVEDLYTFEAETGQTIYFDGVESDWNIKWNVYGQEGENLIGLDYDVSRDLEAITFEAGGEYTLRVWGHMDAVGIYTFQLWDVPPPEQLELASSAGIWGTGSGKIESPGAEDLYVFNVNAGQTLFFDGLESDWNIKWNIIGQEGENLIGLDYDVSRDLEAITFEAGGEYTLRVWGHMDAIGTYAFEIRDGDE